MRTLKRHTRLLLRATADLLSGRRFHFSKKRPPDNTLSKTISLEQEIKNTELVHNKIFNLALAARHINEVIIMPGEIFSFWHIIGDPGKNYKQGRVISGGQLTAAAGGGLCQVSGAIYYASLKAGLHILERHHHSIDLYTNETRYTPLGTDATVVYGYKDLRVKNNFHFPVQFWLDVSSNNFTIHVLSAGVIREKELRFATREDAQYIYGIVSDIDNTVYIQSAYLKQTH